MANKETMYKIVTIYFKGLDITCMGDYDPGESPIWNPQFEIERITFHDDDGDKCAITSLMHELDLIEEITELCLQEIKEN